MDKAGGVGGAQPPQLDARPTEGRPQRLVYIYSLGILAYMTILVYYILSWHIGLYDYIGILTISNDLLFYISIKSPICFV